MCHAVGLVGAAGRGVQLVGAAGDARERAQVVGVEGACLYVPARKEKP